MRYNVRVKTFPDGHRQYIWSKNSIFRIDEENDPEWLVKWAKEKYQRISLKRKNRELDIVDENFECGNDNGTVRFRNNVSRSVNEIYDLARSNHFDWFITLTLSRKMVKDRYDYEACIRAIMLFTDRLRKLGCKWLIVPEQHEDGAYHFHGLVQGDLPLTDSGKTWYCKAADAVVPIMNLANYEFGWTTATRIQFPDRTASYIAKYITKQVAVPRGKKSYWASRSLARPSVDYVQMDDQDFMWDVYAPARFSKEIKSEFGEFLIAEE